MLKSTPGRLGRQTHSGGMIRKHCGWEAMILAPSSQCATSAAPDQSPTAPRRQPTTVGALFFRDTPTGASTKTPHPVHNYFFYQTEAAQYHTENVERTCHVTWTRSKSYGQVHISMCYLQLVPVRRPPFKSHTCISGSHLPFQQSPPPSFQPFSSLPYLLSSHGFFSQNTMTWTRRSQPTFQPVPGSQHGPSRISDPRSSGTAEERSAQPHGFGWVL